MTSKNLSFQAHKIKNSTKTINKFLSFREKWRLKNCGPCVYIGTFLYKLLYLKNT